MRQTHLRAARSATVTLAVLAMTLMVGCGRSGTPRAAVSGTVTLDNTPIPEGSIAFYPMGGSKGHSAGGEIRDGSFTLSAHEGPIVGQCRVEIRATRKTGQITRFGLKEAEMVEQYVPPKYNQQSESTVEVAADGPNQFEFKLSSR